MIQTILRKDAQWTDRLRLDPSQKLWWRLAAFLAHSGDSWFWMIALGIIWLFTRDDWHNRAAMIGFGIVVLALSVFGIKLLFKRRRPDGEWGAIYRNTDPHSFPSGHAARAALLLVMAYGLGPPWFAGLMLVWSPLIAISRVLTGVHYLSDIIAGMLLGIVAGWLILAMQAPIMRLFAIFFIT
ncbi:MAG: phosphatase PAP2 family protein [Anaerolineae bacterium]|jgi:undecaprenyl-diphosphatase|nr:phosphatase PAP2 family protein [Anaerolineae bacterium]